MLVVRASFPDGEVLILEEPLTSGNTTITIGETVLTLASEEATATGSAFGERCIFYVEVLLMYLHL